MGKKKDKFVEWIDEHADVVGTGIGYTLCIGLPIAVTVWAWKHDKNRAEAAMEDYNTELERQRGLVKGAIESGAKSISDTPLGTMITYSDGTVEFV